MVTIREDPYPFLHKIGVQNQNHNDAVSNVESTTTTKNSSTNNPFSIPPLSSCPAACRKMTSPTPPWPAWNCACLQKAAVTKKKLLSLAPRQHHVVASVNTHTCT